jgi:hypothetical protein
MNFYSSSSICPSLDSSTLIPMCVFFCVFFLWINQVLNWNIAGLWHIYMNDDINDDVWSCLLGL